MNADTLEWRKYEANFLQATAEFEVLFVGPDQEFLRKFVCDEISEEYNPRFINPALKNLEWRVFCYMISGTDAKLSRNRCKASKME
eukprot:UN14251